MASFTLNGPISSPIDRKEHYIPIPHTSLTLHAITVTVASPPPKKSSWVIFANSLLANTSLWAHVAPTLTSKSYNLILFDQRGHGQSSVPDPPRYTMTNLADDIAAVLDHFGIEQAHAVIGVSQGGAAVLDFALRHSERTARIVACDTQAKSPETDIVSQDEIELAKKEGMGALASGFAAQWFPRDSKFHPSSDSPESKAVLNMITTTPVLGFEAGAHSLKDYDLLRDGLLQNKVKTLLVAGEKDEWLHTGLMQLQEAWEKEGGDVRFAEVAGAGHLPMLDGAGRWLEVVLEFLE
jgi:pimeloyl-ACP methyl ester carboxylesterase